MSKKDPRRRELLREAAARERQRLLASLPLPGADLFALFDHLDEAAADCDHTLRQTEAFLRGRGLEPERVTPWLREQGGFCDCEVLANLEDTVGEALRREPPDGA